MYTYNVYQTTWYYYLPGAPEDLARAPASASAEVCVYIYIYIYREREI